MPGNNLVCLSNGATLEVFPDGTRVQKNPDGTVITLYASGEKKQLMKDGTEIIVRQDGSRTQKMINGIILEIDSSGNSIQTNPDGSMIKFFALDKRRVNIHADGTSVEVLADGTKIVSHGHHNHENENKIDLNNADNQKPPLPKRDSFMGIGRVPQRRSVSSGSGTHVDKAEYSANDAIINESALQLQQQKIEYEKKIESLENYIFALNEEKIREVNKKDLELEEITRQLETVSTELNTLKTRNLSQDEINKLSFNQDKVLIEELTIKHQELQKAVSNLATHNLLLEERIEELIDKGGSAAEHAEVLRYDNAELVSENNDLIEEVSKLQKELASAMASNVELESKVNNIISNPELVGMLKKRDLYLNKYSSNGNISRTPTKGSNGLEELNINEFDDGHNQLPGVRPTVLSVSESSLSIGLSPLHKQSSAQKHLSAVKGNVLKLSSKLFGKKDDERQALFETVKQMQQRITELETNIAQKDLMIKTELMHSKNLQVNLVEREGIITTLKKDSTLEARVSQLQQTIEDIHFSKQLVETESFKKDEQIRSLREQLKNSSIILETDLAIKLQRAEQRIQQLERLNGDQTDTTTAKKFVPRTGAEVEKYARMQRAGVPEGAIRMCMQRDGVPTNWLFPDKDTGHGIISTQGSMDLQIPAKESAAYAKYTRMEKAGVPEGAIVNAMRRDNVDPEPFLANSKITENFNSPSCGEKSTGFLDQISKTAKGTLRHVDASLSEGSMGSEQDTLRNTLLEEIKQRGRTRLRRVSKTPIRGFVPSHDVSNANAIAELCRLKAQQRSERSRKVNDLMSQQQKDISSTPHISSQGQSELFAALNRRAKKLEIDIPDGSPESEHQLYVEPIMSPVI